MMSVKQLLVALKECTKLRDIERGKLLHAAANRSGDCCNLYVASALVGLYAKCGSMVDARNVFDGLEQRDVVMWNALILGYAENGEGHVAMGLFLCMQWHGYAPNSRTFVAALKACSVLAEEDSGVNDAGFQVLPMGRAIHCRAFDHCGGPELHVENTLIDMYGKCRSMADAQKVFDGMLHCDVVSWTATISGYAENGQGDWALVLFSRMKVEGCQANVLTFVAAIRACTSLQEDKLYRALGIHSLVARVNVVGDVRLIGSMVDIYGKLGILVNARRVLDHAKYPDVMSWTALMLAYVESGEGKAALETFRRMQLEGIRPDALAFVAALKACGNIAALEVGRGIHSMVHENGMEYRFPVVSSALVDFYGKCSSTAEAQEVFDGLPARDVVTWNALIGGFARIGHVDQVFNLFHKMVDDEGLQPDAVTVLCLLTVCCHAGLVDKGKECFESMYSKYGVVPKRDHYHCVIDMLGRVNAMEDVIELMKTMPMSPSVATWTTILDACRKWGNVELGKLAFDSLLGLETGEAGPYLLAKDMYLSEGIR